MKYRNAAAAMVAKLSQLLLTGEEVSVRGKLTRESMQQLVSLSNPLERCIVVPARHNNVFASIAETMWVIAGRSDIAYLSNYLPRAVKFSDDGETWRAGYGPRLRHWPGVDQFDAVVRTLTTAPTSRRAVMSIFDPSVDYQDSLDVPCTNWLHFTVRDNKLDLSIAVRSNDIMWGFSGINTFEWSVVQEMMAHWLRSTISSRHCTSTNIISNAPHGSSLHLQQSRRTTSIQRLRVSRPHSTALPRSQMTGSKSKRGSEVEQTWRIASTVSRTRCYGISCECSTPTGRFRRMM
jgi:thymidylate synthase